MIEVISGGQTGADQGGLRAARVCGIKTGGWAPRGYMTEVGPKRYVLGQVYGLKEHPSPKYPPRTAANIADADMTIIFAGHMDSGSSLTLNLCFKLGKPVFHVGPIDYDATGLDLLRSVSEVWKWVERRPHQIINIAGNRESKSPGICDKTTAFLIKLFEAMI